MKSVTMSPNLSASPLDRRHAGRTSRWLPASSRRCTLRIRDFRMADVLALLEAHPDWQEINRHVRQKPCCSHAQGAQQ